MQLFKQIKKCGISRTPNLIIAAQMHILATIFTREFLSFDEVLNVVRNVDMSQSNTVFLCTIILCSIFQGLMVNAIIFGGGKKSPDKATTSASFNNNRDDYKFNT